MNVILKNLFNCNITKKYKFLVLFFTFFMINISVYADELGQSEFNNILQGNQETVQTLNTSEEFSNIENYNQMKYGWQYINGNKYYFDENGVMQKGIINVDGTKYFFGEYSGVLKYGFVTALNGDVYYTSNDGIIRTGIQMINGNKYYFNENGIMQKGIIDIDGTRYFFGEYSGVLKYGFVTALNGYLYYTANDGIIRTGIQQINGNKYYFNENGIMQKGIIDINGTRYFFGEYSGVLKYGLVTALNGDVYYTANDGIIRTGIQEIGGNKYYFDANGIMRKGIIEIDGTRYFFGEYSGVLKYGLVTALNGDVYYTSNDGIIRTEIQKVGGNKYYFDETGIMRKGIININGIRYFFGEYSGALKYGFVKSLNNNIYYTGNDGVVRTGSQTINNIDYIFKDDGKLTDGWHLINNDFYYIQNGRYMTGNVWINGKTNIFTSSGIYLGIQYTPYYYMQTAGSWANVYYGSGSMKKTGCLPTSVAMALSGILGRSILPTDIASYLYYYTNEFNKITLGASGLAVQYAAKYFGVKCEGINSLSQLNDALSRGKIIVASMGTGKFAKPWYTHEIVLYNYSNGITIAYDPINSSNNGWISTYDVWNQRSFDPYDLRGGYSFYALSL